MLNNTKRFSCFSKTPFCTLNKLIADILIHSRKHPRNLALGVSSIGRRLKDHQQLLKERLSLGTLGPRVLGEPCLFASAQIKRPIFSGVFYSKTKLQILFSLPVHSLVHPYVRSGAKLITIPWPMTKSQKSWYYDLYITDIFYQEREAK